VPPTRAPARGPFVPQTAGCEGQKAWPTAVLMPSGGSKTAVLDTYVAAGRRCAQAVQPALVAAGLTRNKRPRGRAPAGYCWDEQKGGWFDDNGKPFELASSLTTPQGSGLQPSARQRWRRPNRSSPKPLPHPTPLLSPSTRLASTHLVRLLYLLHLLHLLHPHHTYSACYDQDHGKPEEQEAANHPSSNSASSCSVCAQSVYRPPLAIMTLDQRSGVPFIARAASKTIFVPPNN